MVENVLGEVFEGLFVDLVGPDEQNVVEYVAVIAALLTVAVGQPVLVV